MNESQLIERLSWRYAVKKFDPNKKITASIWQALEDAIVLSPSSYGLQPWKFLVVQTPEIRAKLKAVSWNQPQVEDCSHYVVLLAKNNVSEADVQKYVDRIVQVRGVPKDSLTGYFDMMVGDVVKGPRSRWVKEWATRQCYIALGQAMASAAMLGVDTCPMEGLDPEKYDEILGLNASGYHTVCALAVGYRHQDDRLAAAKKVRFPNPEIVQFR